MSSSSSRHISNGGESGNKHVVIVGAGVGGCALAARLAHRGHRVTVVEKHSGPGGRCSLFTSDDHRWDVGPSLYLMPELFAAFFQSVDRNIDDYVKLKRCEPSYKVHFAPKNHDALPDPPLELSTCLPELGPQLDRFERPAGNPDGLGSFLAFLSEAGDHYEESVRHVLLRDWNNLFAALTRWDVYPMLIRTQALKIWSTAWRRACHYFKSDQVRRAMTFSAMYMGMSPFDAPATYTLLQYAEYAKGVFYPVGGFQTLVAAFANVAKEFHATFMYDTQVNKILVDGSGANKVRGVELSDGRTIEADVVVSNADLIWTYNNLLPPSEYAQRLQKKKQTCSSISFYWGLSETVKELGIHNIFLAEQYRESFDEIFNEGKVPSEPSFYVNVPSRIDASAAPNGGDTLVVLVPCGPITSQGSAPKGYADKETFMEVKERVRAQILQTLRARIGRDLAPLIKEERIMDPWDWQDRYGLWNGSILGLSHCVSQVLWFRPSNQHSSLKNMFFVGASAMPGTGVPVVCAGSGIVADKIDHYLRKGAPKTHGGSGQAFVLYAVLFAILALVCALGLRLRS